eukprot:CAMPEP_0172039776 /NCGR_PEP_ID=MMETSP1041-20130122/24097_1 /TAXON_ID=464988 /ORGANISM="Hemiselmis andersenii, Strain CCMP439" /LENGTH=48 /DNA_ID= /DNA_START= /DNA_END= /DNA_ORIENTATION=
MSTWEAFIPRGALSEKSSSICIAYGFALAPLLFLSFLALPRVLRRSST